MIEFEIPLSNILLNYICKNDGDNVCMSEANSSVQPIESALTEFPQKFYFGSF